MSRLQKFIRWGLYVPLLLPLLYTPFTFFSWNFGKTLLVEVWIEILAVLFVVAHWHKPQRQWWKALTSVDKSLLIFLAIALLASAVGVNFGKSFWGNQVRTDGLIVWVHLLIWMLLLKAVCTNKDWSTIFIGNTIVAALVALSVFFEHYLPIQSSAGGGIIGNRAFAASYLLVSVGIAVLAALRTATPWLRYSLYGTAIILAFGIIATQNRGSFLGLTIGTMVALIIGLWVDSSTKRRTVIAVTLAGLLLVSGALLAASRNASFRVSVPSLEYLRGITEVQSGTGATRLLTWQTAIQAVRERPLLGWGWENFDVPFNKYYNPALFRYSFAETVWDKPHNWFLEVAVTAGAIGLAAYVGLYGAVLYTIAKKARSEEWKYVSAVLAGSFVGYAVQDMFLFETINALALFFLLTAFVSQQSQSSKAEQSSGGVVLSRKKWYAVPLAIAGGLVWFIWLDKVFIIPLRASYYLMTAHAANDAVTWADNATKALDIPTLYQSETALFLAERYTQLDKAGVSLTSMSAVRAAEAVATALESDAAQHPDNPTSYIWAGQVYMTLGEQTDQRYLADAEKALTQAAQLSPRKQDILLLLGRTYLLEKKFAQALAVNQQAVDADPTIGTSHWFYGLALVASGNIPKGINEIEQALSLSYSPQQAEYLYVLDLYAGQKMYDKVIAGYTKLLNEEPDNVTWYIRLATAYALAGQKAQALQIVQQAVAIDPSLAPSAQEFIKQYKLQ